MNWIGKISQGYCTLKFLVSLFLFSCVSTGVAAEQEAVILAMQLKIDGELVSKPTVITISGETASIQSMSTDGDGFSIAVTPTLTEKNQVEMTFVVTRLEKDKKTILSKPHMVSLLGQPAEITEVSKDDRKTTMSLAVTPSLKD